MITMILELISSLLKSIPIISKWFTKTATEKIDNKQEDRREEQDKTEQTGRPQWK